MKCVITGATSGIGKEFARILSNKGYELILIGRNKNKLREIKKLGKTSCIDLSKEKDVIKLTKKLKKEKIDMVINNAGIGVYGLFKDSKLQGNHQIIWDVNLKGIKKGRKKETNLFKEDNEVWKQLIELIKQKMPKSMNLQGGMRLFSAKGQQK